MFTFFLMVIFFAAIILIFKVTFSKPNEIERQKKMALSIATIRYLKRCAEECTDGLAVLDYTKRRDEAIDDLLNYLEKHKISDCDQVKEADIIKLDDYRPRQSA
ncbi:hypothetical protein ALT761_01974 [Alteromonas sp. 76-1]|jgi:hypothetical protein|uniref:hypothetical protein n=1 Tax=Alteromonas sp. 76-1 TaxID=2358187 RepID=UPI000FD1820D|nr:hypothetical protein [Alteromonas sp. 76-1]VEL96975.1 hypothetical protein ALT761_01974 [Alteromonas sp. 76-1]